MARKKYTAEFRRRVVDLCESTPGASLNEIAVDLGISRGALKERVHKLGSGTTTTGPGASAPAGRQESHAAWITRLEAENTTLRGEARKLETERDILRQAAKYSPGRRTGDPLPVRRGPQGRQWREAVV